MSLLNTFFSIWLFTDGFQYTTLTEIYYHIAVSILGAHILKLRWHRGPVTRKTGPFTPLQTIELLLCNQT